MKKTPVKAVAPMPAPVVQPDGYEEGALEVLKILKEVCWAVSDPLRRVDAGIASGLMQPVINILGEVVSKVESRVLHALTQRRVAAKGEKVAGHQCPCDPPCTTNPQTPVVKPPARFAQSWER